MKEKKRLDILIVEKGFCESRQLAQSLILQGRVKVGGKVETKAGTAVEVQALIDVNLPEERFVSRGGIKLEKALEVFALETEGRIALDLGSSTGGFSECLLSHGVSRIYAVDVGKGQLHHKLRTDSRITAIEGFNARYLTEREVPEKVDIVTADLSFISLALLFPVIARMMKEGGAAVVLVKPQFEAGRRNVRKGVVKDPAVHCQVIEQVIAEALRTGLSCSSLTFSPLKGPSGNIEFFLHLRHAHETDGNERPIDSAAVVEEAHACLGKACPLK